MATISIDRAHGLTHDQARNFAERIATDIELERLTGGSTAA